MKKQKNMDFKIKGSASRAFVTSTLAFAIGFAAVTLFSPLVTYLGLEVEQKGVLLAIVSLTGALLRIPFAAWADKIGGKKPMLTLLSVALIGLVGITVLIQFPIETVINKLFILIFFGALAGFGLASFTVSVTQLSFWFPKDKQGKPLGVMSGIGGIAPGLVLMIISYYLSRGLDITKVYFIWSVLLLVGIIVYLLLEVESPYFQALSYTNDEKQAREMARQAGQEIFPTGSTIKSLVVATKSPQTWLLVMLYFVCFGGFLALTNWFKEFFKDYHGLSVTIASVISSSYSMGVSVSRGVGGIVSDKVGGKRLANINVILAIIGFLLLTTSSIFIINITGVIILTVSMGMVGAASFKLIPVYVPHAVGGAAGLIGGLGALGGFVFPIVLSTLLDADLPDGALDRGYIHGFYFLAGLMVLSFIVINLLPSDRPKKAS